METENVFDEWKSLSQGQVLTVEDRTHYVVNIRVVPLARSQSFEQNEIRIRWTSQEGNSQIVTKRFTVVSPEVEPICTEWVANGSGRSVLNPSGVVVGQDSVFRIKVKPNAYPDSKIVWSTTGAGAVSFPEGNTGREVKVRGVFAGEITLKAQIGECTASTPSFHAKVVQPKTVKLSAWIIADKNGVGAFTPAQVRTMVREANEIYSQVGVTLDVGNRIVVTNIPAAYVIRKLSESAECWRFARLAAEGPHGEGVDCYFVCQIIDDCATAQEGYEVIGLHRPNSIAVSSSAGGKTLAHEFGHEFGMSDVYPVNGRNVDLFGYTCWNCCMSDWNGGCDGSGENGCRYYPVGTLQRDIVYRLLMNGCQDDINEGLDITYGAVYGYGYDDLPECQNTGFFDN